jgi:hypothetical protein|tara:strand:- start:1012 stop:1734 length:723 start_codon:yes stop_codon:yes gene_type:complete
MIKVISASPLFFLLILLTACSTAKRSSEVGASYIAANNFEGKSCQQIFLLAEELKQKTPMLERRVDETRRQDKIKEQVGLWLFWPTYFFMEGNAQEQTELAIARGNINALRTAALANGCNVNQSLAVRELGSTYNNNAPKNNDNFSNNSAKNQSFMQEEELKKYLEEIFKAKIDREALRQILRLYEKGVISKRTYEAETKIILNQADQQMLEELEKLLEKGLITFSSYENSKKGILVKSN